jgi:hypothetical protein
VPRKEPEMKGWAIAAVVAVAGCGGDGATGGGDMGGMAETCNADGKAVSLNGKFAVRANLVVNVKVGMDCSGSACIVDNDADSELLLLADITQSGTTATATVRPCKIVIPPVALKNQPMPVQITVPSTLVDSVLPVSSMAALGGGSTCATFDAQPITLALGASLATPASDPLPNFTSGAQPPVAMCGGVATTACASAANPVGPTQTGCACDQEGDAKLGATVLAKNAPAFEDIDKLYVDLRTSVTLKGQVFPEAAGQAHPGQRIKGTVEGLKLDQNVLGCHHAVAAPGTPRDCSDSETGAVAGFNPVVSQSVNAPSTFVAVPIGAGDTCETIKAQEATLFP